MRKLYWLRHGPTHQTVFTGWRDVPVDLSDTALIARTAALLPDDALVVSSDLQRASRTADMLAGPRTRLPDQPGLREINFGDWDGLSFEQVIERAPELSRSYWEDPGDISPPNGESWNQAGVRIEVTLKLLLATYPARPLVLVSHLGAILTQISRATGDTANKTLAQHLRNYSLTEIHLDGPQRRVHRVDHVA